MNMRVVIWAAVSTPRQGVEDKISLIEQERAGREWAAANGGEVVAVLKIPGESRSDTDVLSIFEEFAAAGVYAYHDLRRLWQEPRGFDVLFCYHESRLGRSESLFTYVVANVMRSGARIWCHLGGWYEPKDYKLKMAIGMINVSSEMDRLSALGWAAKEAKAPQGLMVHGSPPWSHKTIRDEHGRAVKLVPDESKRPIIEAAARLVIEGVPWLNLEQELFARYGYTHENGKPFYRWFFYALFFKPTFWGIAVRGHQSRYKSNDKVIHQRYPVWVIDPAAPVPEGIKIWRDAAPPYLPDDETLGEHNLGGRLKEELRRRRAIVKGRRHSRTNYRFSGLLVCFYCGYSMSFGRVGKHEYHRYACKSMYTELPNRCDRYRSIAESVVQEWFNEQLLEMLRENDPERLINRHRGDTERQRVPLLEAQMQRLDEQINRAVSEQLATNDPALIQIYRNRIMQMSTERTAVERELQSLRARSAAAAGSVSDAYRQLRALVEGDDLTKFWSQPDHLINQILFGLMDDRVLVIKDFKVVGDAERKRDKPVKK